MMRLKLSLAIGLIIAFKITASQGALDSLKISLPDAEKIFLQKNLQLLAYKFNVNAADAAIIQAKLWSNPTLSVEQNIYNQYTNKYFDFTSSGNTGIQIQQLITLAGKKDKQIKIATLNKEMAENNFTDLLRNLKHTLRISFYDLFYLQNSLGFYNESIPSIKKAVDSMEGVYSNRSVLLAEMMRLKSLLFSLETERLNILNQIAGLENDLGILLNESRDNIIYVPQLKQDEIDKADISLLNPEELIAASLDCRPDYKNSDTNIRTEEANLSLQKAMAVPDLTVGGLWSRQGGYIPDYWAVTFSIDLPIFNRNQGNIEVSKNTLEADKRLKDAAKNNIIHEITSSYSKAMEIDKFYKGFDKNFASNYTKLVESMIQNYEKRYITIIEFTDSYESYRNSIVQMNQLRNNRTDAFEDLNYRIGKDIIQMGN